MKCNVTRGFQVLLVLVLVLSLCMTTGCGGKSKTKKPASDKTELFKETVAAPTAAPETKPAVKEKNDGLVSVRQSVVGTPQIFAAAYFGDGAEDPYVTMQEATPGLCEALPFLLDIPQDRVIGEAGDLFCIVPADENATVAVSRGYWDDENQQCIYDNMVYSSSSGEPILLFCNSGGWVPDTQVYICGESGEVYWYPQPDDNKCAMAVTDDNGENLFLDFTDYSELLQTKHTQMMEAEWAAPTAEMLENTSWSWESYLLDSREVHYQVIFEEEILSVRWNDGFDEMDHEYLYAPWELTYEGDYAVLTIDFGDFAGTLRYNLLYHEVFEQLYVALDVTQEDLPVGWEPLFRILSKPQAPEPADMIGTWELAWTEVEGERVEAEPGERTIEIQSAASAGLLMSYTSREFPDNNFSNELLTIDARQMYILCGNDEWVADVNYTGPWDTTYAVTLTVDDILIKQNYFLLDGAPSVSYEYFSRVGY